MILAGPGGIWKNWAMQALDLLVVCEWKLLHAVAFLFQAGRAI